MRECGVRIVGGNVAVSAGPALLRMAWGTECAPKELRHR